MSSLTSVLPRILGFLSKGEDYLSASQVSRSWRAASHAAKPQTLLIDTCFYWDSSSSGDEEADGRRRLHMLWVWFKLKMDTGRMTELRSVTLDLTMEEADMEEAWCLIMKDLEIFHLLCTGGAIDQYHHLLSNTITHLEVTPCLFGSTDEVCASKLRHLTRLRELTVRCPFLLDFPFHGEKLVLGEILSVAKDACLNTLLPNIRQLDLRVSANLEGQKLGDRILELPTLVKAHFTLSLQESVAKGRLKFQCPEKVELTVSNVPLDLQVFICKNVQQLS